MRKIVLTCVVLVLGLGLVSRTEAAPLGAPFDLYEAGPFNEDTWSRASAALTPWKPIHQEKRDGFTWVLLALSDGDQPTGLEGWGRPRYLGRVREGEHVVYAMPFEGGDRLRSGRSVTVSPAGGTVYVTSETSESLAERAPHQFRVLARAIPPRQVELDDRGAPERFQAVLERAQRRSRASEQDVLDLIATVEIDSLESFVRSLSETEVGSATSRYFARPETESTHQFTIETRLAASLGVTAISEHAFRMEGPGGSDSITVHNVVAKYASAAENPGAIMLTAHYDAIGNRSVTEDLCEAGLLDGCDCEDPSSWADDPDCSWQWDRDAAPGADDNASGVAVLIEAARHLSTLAFDFDVYFVAFQGEELGLHGSAAFADSVAAAGQEVFAVFNMDMVAHSLSRVQLDLVGNEGSEWMVDYLIDTQQKFVPTLPVNKHIEFFGRSDHASFWSVGIDAVLLIEDKDVVYPRYHEFLDRLDVLSETDSRTQFELATQLVVAAVSRLALEYDDPDFVLASSEIEVEPVTSNTLSTDQTLLVRARVFNQGSSEFGSGDAVTNQLSVRVSFYDGDPAQGGSLIAQQTQTEVFPSGGFVEFVALWEPEAGAEGFHDVFAVVEPITPGLAGREVTAENNSASTRVFLEGALPRVLDHFAYPNPLSGAFSSFNFSYDLSASSNVDITIYDLDGSIIATFGAPATFITNGNQAGRNVIAASRFSAESTTSTLTDLPSGPYVYRIRVRDLAGATTDVSRGRFVVVR